MWAAVWLVVSLLSSWQVDAVTRSSKRIADASSVFSIDLLRTVLRQTQGNVIISPLSVSTLLAMLQQGAWGNSSLQLENVLHANQEEARLGYGQIIQSLKMRKSKSLLEFGNSVFINNDIGLVPKYRDILHQNFYAGVEPINFRHPDEAARQINKWVAQATRNRIQQLISPDVITQRTEMVLANAIFFKGIWLRTFSVNRTYVGSFSPEPGQEVPVPFMHQVGRFRAGEDHNLGAKWVELPFDGEEFSMVILLPSERYALDSLLSRMTPQDLINMLSTRKTKQVILNLPRFKLHSSSTLVPTLQALGLKDIFNTKSNLGGISNNNRGPLSVSDIIHRAEIEVNEEGSTATAATGILVNTLSLASYLDDLTFTANHPFLAIIVDRVNSVPLFTGRLSNPLKF